MNRSCGCTTRRRRKSRLEADDKREPSLDHLGSSIHYRVKDTIRSVVAIENVSAAINQIAQTTLRAVVGRHPLALQLRNLQTLVEMAHAETTS